MDLTTRCPHCGTVFQASLADLQLRKGYIRCIQCAHIFDGYAEVVSEADTGAETALGRPAAPAAAPAPTSAPADPALEPEYEPAPAPRTGPGVGGAGAVALRFRARRREPHLGDERPGMPAAAGGPGALEPTLPAFDASADDDVADGADGPLVLSADPLRASGRGTAAPWLDAPASPTLWQRLGRALAWPVLLVLIALALAQLAYVYRAQLAQAVPPLRTPLEAGCRLLACSVPYARTLDQAAIVSSALKSVDGATAHAAEGADAPAAEHAFVLDVTLRNATDRAQEWPTLVLDLKDSAGTLLVRRNLAPSDYLDAATRAGPFAAGRDVRLQVPFKVRAAVHVNGYQLALFYP